MYSVVERLFMYRSHLTFRYCFRCIELYTLFTFDINTHECRRSLGHIFFVVLFSFFPHGDLKHFLNAKKKNLFVFIKDNKNVNSITASKFLIIRKKDKEKSKQ